jgi:hypothetical protein
MAMTQTFVELYATLVDHRDNVRRLLAFGTMTHYDNQRVRKYLDELNQMVAWSRMQANVEMTEGV